MSRFKNAGEMLTDALFGHFCHVWQRDGRCPADFVDYLSRHGLFHQADAAGWAAREPDRPGFYGTEAAGGVCPCAWPDDGYAWGHTAGPQICRQYVPADVWANVPVLKAANGREPRGAPTFAGAIAAFLDAWAEYRRGKLSAIISSVVKPVWLPVNQWSCWTWFDNKKV